MTETKYWKTVADLKSGCNYFYANTLPGPSTDDNRSDDAYGQATNSISDGSRTAPATDDTWNNYWIYIFNANNIIEKSANITGLQADVNRYKAEARFFRAYTYFNLVQRYGDVPWIEHALQYSDPELYGNRVNREIIIDSIYSDLDYAAAYLTLPGSIADADYGRISRTAAWAFKSRVALFEGTRQKYHGYGTPAKHLQIALDASQAVINSKEHSLYTGDGTNSYFSLFQLKGEGKTNKENIIVRIYGESQANNIAVHNYGRGTLEAAQFTPTKALVDAFLYTDGLPKGVSPLCPPDVDINDDNEAEFKNRDPRLAMVVFTTGKPFKGGQTYDSKAFSMTRTGYHFMKYYDDATWTSQLCFTDMHILRYAEVLLNNIEAKYELNGSVDDLSLENTINTIRSRAGLTIKLTNAFIAANPMLNMRDEIRRERHVELAGEGFRYFDLLRWKTAETELIKSVMGRMAYTNGVANRVLTVVQSSTTRNFNPKRDYLFPLPTNEIGKLKAVNPTWEQNPGW